MKYTFYRSFLAFAGGMTLAILIPCLFVPPAHAQSVQTITLVPPTAEFTLEPGSHVEGSFRIVSDSSLPVSFAVSVADFIVDNPDGKPHLFTDVKSVKPGAARYMAASWVSPDQAEFTLNPKSREVISYSIDVPTNALPGGHYASVVFSPKSSATSSLNNATLIKTQVGALIYITVKGQMRTEAALSNLVLPRFLEYGPIPVTFDISNLGDSHIHPSGTIEAHNLLGGKIGQNISDYNIFPLASRTYHQTLGSAWMIGPQRVTITATYAPGKEVQETRTVWVLPWKVLVIMMQFIIVIALAFSLWRNRETFHTDRHR